MPLRMFGTNNSAFDCGPGVRIPATARLIGYGPYETGSGSGELKSFQKCGVDNGKQRAHNVSTSAVQTQSQHGTLHSSTECVFSAGGSPRTPSIWTSAVLLLYELRAASCEWSTYQRHQAGGSVSVVRKEVPRIFPVRVHFKGEQDRACRVAQGCPCLDRPVAVDRNEDLVELSPCGCRPWEENNVSR